MIHYTCYFLFSIFFIASYGLKIPGDCVSGQYYDTGILECDVCPSNASLIVAPDGFGCSCEANSIPVGVNRCKPCNSTDVVSDDGLACVPRHCQVASGRIVCRRCSTDSILVTRNYDGHPRKEVLCVKCARGYKPQNNHCVKYEGYNCNKSEVIVQGICVPRQYVDSRPKAEDSKLHPATLLEVVKQEYLCTQRDPRACRKLARMCVKFFYRSDVTGPCRLWLSNETPLKGLPQMILTDKNAGELELVRGQDAMQIVMIAHTNSGGIRVLKDASQKISSCLPPFQIKIGDDMKQDCVMNLSNPDPQYTEVFQMYLYFNGEFKPIPVSLIDPRGNLVQKGMWPSDKFQNFFILNDVLSTVTNITDKVYLRVFRINIKVDRDEHIAGSLRLLMSVKLQYDTKPLLLDMVTTTFEIYHDMPSAGVLRGLEIWGGVLGTLLTLYATVQWGGIIYRGGLRISIVPLLMGAISDTLYFAAFFSTLHALAAEAGTLGMTLPLSQYENTVVTTFVYVVFSLKAVKLAWINWRQCRCEIFFIDWAEYCPYLSVPHLLSRFPVNKTSPCNQWKSVMLAKELASMQATRRAPPVATVTLTIIILQLMSPWQVPKSEGYMWAMSAIAWWVSYATVLLTRWVHDKFRGAPTQSIVKVCQGLEISLLIFEEKLYAHYVHGRNSEPLAVPYMGGPPNTCGVAFSPVISTLYKQLSQPEREKWKNSVSNKIILSRFLAAFFDRALDGFMWVSKQRRLIEKLNDIEILVDEGTDISTLLFDPDNDTPCCFAVTWWGDEWNLATFDAMFFGFILLATGQPFVSGLASIAVWQIMTLARTWLGNRNIKEKVGVAF